MRVSSKAEKYTDLRLHVHILCGSETRRRGGMARGENGRPGGGGQITLPISRARRLATHTQHADFRASAGRSVATRVQVLHAVRVRARLDLLSPPAVAEQQGQQDADTAEDAREHDDRLLLRLLAHDAQEDGREKVGVHARARRPRVPLRRGGRAGAPRSVLARTAMVGVGDGGGGAAWRACVRPESGARSGPRARPACGSGGRGGERPGGRAAGQCLAGGAGPVFGACGMNVRRGRGRERERGSGARRW
mmetsp:Transcript_46108/g.153867  ORF Transcript_46108/g.153867 Transcript_46108/m.153867 type:complete len:250 (+) Transcript_46108:52-801(+)